MLLLLYVQKIGSASLRLNGVGASPCVRPCPDELCHWQPGARKVTPQYRSIKKKETTLWNNEIGKGMNMVGSVTEKEAPFGIVTSFGSFDRSRLETHPPLSRQEIVTQIFKQASFEKRVVLLTPLRKIAHRPTHDFHRMGKTQAVRVQIRLHGGVMHQGTEGKMGQQEAIQFLRDQLRSQSTQGTRCQAQLVFLLIQARFNFPSLVIDLDQFHGWGEQWVQHGCHQAMDLVGLTQDGVGDLILDHSQG